MLSQQVTQREAPGLTVEKLDGDKILHFTITSSSRATVDAFIATVKDEQKDWPSDRVGYYIYDFSKNLTAFSTPYSKERLNELIKWRPELRSYAAIVVPNNMFLQLFRLFLREKTRRGSINHICFSREEALTWLHQMMANPVVDDPKRPSTLNW